MPYAAPTQISVAIVVAAILFVKVDWWVGRVYANRVIRQGANT
jgi:hypothetical protein